MVVKYNQFQLPCQRVLSPSTKFAATPQLREQQALEEIEKLKALLAAKQS
jgi:hypothetical protein